MKIYSSLKSAFKFALRKKGVVLIIYLSILILGLVFSLPLRSSLVSTAGHRLEIQQLLTSFDYTAYTDYINEFGDIFKPLVSQVKWLVIAYLLLHIFFTGGIFHMCNSRFTDSSTVKDFFTGGQKFFGRIALNQLIFLLIQIGIMLVVWVPTVIMLSGGLEKASSEKPYVNTIIVAVIITILLTAVGSMISDYVKAGLIRDENSKYFKVFAKQFSIAVKNFGNTFGLYLVQVALFVLLFWIYFIIEKSIGNNSGWSILLLFVIQQIVIFKRISLRVFGLSSAWYMNEQLSPHKKETGNDSMSILGLTEMIGA